MIDNKKNELNTGNIPPENIFLEETVSISKKHERKVIQDNISTTDPALDLSVTSPQKKLPTLEQPKEKKELLESSSLILKSFKASNGGLGSSASSSSGNQINVDESGIEAYYNFTGKLDLTKGQTEDTQDAYADKLENLSVYQLESLSYTAEKYEEFLYELSENGGALPSDWSKMDKAKSGMSHCNSQIDGSQIPPKTLIEAFEALKTITPAIVAAMFIKYPAIAKILMAGCDPWDKSAQQNEQYALDVVAIISQGGDIMGNLESFISANPQARWIVDSLISNFETLKPQYDAYNATYTQNYNLIYGGDGSDGILAQIAQLTGMSQAEVEVLVTALSIGKNLTKTALLQLLDAQLAPNGLILQEKNNLINELAKFGITLNSITDIGQVINDIKRIEQAKAIAQQGFGANFKGPNALALFTEAQLSLQHAQQELESDFSTSISNIGNADTNDIQQLRKDVQNLIYWNTQYANAEANANKLNPWIEGLGYASLGLTGASFICGILNLTPAAPVSVIAGLVIDGLLIADNLAMAGLQIAQGVYEREAGEDLQDMARASKAVNMDNLDIQLSQQMADTITQNLITMIKKTEAMAKDAQSAISNMNAAVPLSRPA